VPEYVSVAGGVKPLPQEPNESTPLPFVVRHCPELPSDEGSVQITFVEMLEGARRPT
jgi:hypothetical protein